MIPHHCRLFLVISLACLSLVGGTAFAGEDPVQDCMISGDLEICGESTKLCAPEGFLLYRWTGPEGLTSEERCVVATRPGVYEVTVTSREDFSETSCSVEVVQTTGEPCLIEGEPSICEGGSTQLCGSKGYASYAWSFPDGGIAETRCIDATMAGVYALIAIDEAGCPSKCKVEVVEREAAPCVIEGDLFVCEGGTTELCGPDGFASYAWSGPEEFSADTRCIQAGFGVYTLTVTTEDGCSTSCEANVEIADIFLPCEIVGATTILEGETTELCGPADAAGYSWTGPEEFTADSKCIEVSTAGTYTLTLDLGQGCTSTCEVEVVVQTLPDCPEELEFTICDGDSTEVCGPEGAEFYSWMGPEGFQADTRCVTVGEAGAYTVVASYTLPKSDAHEVACEFTVIVEDCTPQVACPRPAGFWAEQCFKAPIDFSAEEFAQLAKHVDSQANSFDWPDGEEMDLFCEALNPPAPVDTRAELKRQFVTLLANVCAGELGLTSFDGQAIKLDPETEVQCPDAPRVRDLILLLDGLFTPLKGDEGDPEMEVLLCTEGVNTGDGLVEVCDYDWEEREEAGLGDGEDEPTVQPESTASLQLRAAPNPFSTETVVSFALPEAGAVDIAVYDVVGRRVKTLASGDWTQGAHRVFWDGRNERGVPMARGIYYVRATLADRGLSARVLYLK